MKDANDAQCSYTLIASDSDLTITEVVQYEEYSLTYVGSSGSSSCSDTSYGATDDGGDACTWYDSNQSDCGNYDDTDFFANTMCCACGGGSSTGSGSSTFPKDIVFTAED